MMKRVVIICLVIFWTFYAAIVSIGFAQHTFSKDKPTSTVAPTTNTQNSGQTTLDTTEVAKHASSNSCWLIIDSKVYDITGYFGSHPAGNAIMVNFCGKEASVAYHLSPHRHSGYADSLLAKYLLGNLGETSANSQK